jgi:hypothetical protein
VDIGVRDHWLTITQVMDREAETEITITVFRLLVLDLLALFQVLNQAMINILGMLTKRCPFLQILAYARFRSLLRDVEARCRKSYGCLSDLHQTD